jgi:hypothetical protein
MTRTSAILTAGFFICGTVFGQTPQATPRFEIADVRVGDLLSVSAQLPVSTSLHGGHYEFRHATMVDLVSNAYGVKPDKVVGGPSSAGGRVGFYADVQHRADGQRGRGRCGRGSGSLWRFHAV